MKKVSVSSSSFRTRVSRHLRLGVCALAAGSILLLLPQDALASPGCTAINSGAFNLSATSPNPGTASQNGFTVGDRLTVRYGATDSRDHFRLWPTGVAGADLDNFNPFMGTTTTVHTLTASQLGLTITITAVDFQVTASASCVAAPTPAPTVTSISPIAGPVAGGAAVTITGTNFTGATAVAVGGAPATGVTVVSDTSITATTPAHAAGAVDVVVTTSAGSGTGTGLYTYVAAPTVTSIAPASGPAGGGTAVSITGTGFTGATAVTIGGVAATGITVVNATTITVVTGARAAGVVSVVVTTAGGNGTGVGIYTYAAVPTVTSILPAAATVAGGTTVSITGTGFTGATAVTIGGEAASGITVVNATTITVTTPAHAAGAVDVVVTTPGGAGMGTGIFTYVTGPTVTAISPTSGTTAGGAAVTITGTDLTGATSVTIGGVAATGMAVVNATTITAITAGHAAGTVDVVVTTPGGAATGTGLFTYAAAPTVTVIGPTSGATIGGTFVTITGTSLTGATAVMIGGVAATGIAVVNATTITAMTAGHAAGAVDVVVTTPGGTGTGAGIYTYLVTAPSVIVTSNPTISTISPGSGPSAGGTAVSISGTDLSGATGVTIGGVAATDIAVVNASTITAKTAGHAAGAAEVVVTTTAGTATGSVNYTYVAIPIITSINPTSGSVAGGTAVTITGTGLTGANAVTIGDVEIAGMRVVSATTITGTTTAHAAGAATVSVTTQGGTGVGPGLYTYTAILTLASTASAVTQVGQPYSQTNSAGGGTPGYGYAVSEGSVPPGTVFNPATSAVSGTPTSSGAFSYTITVTDSSPTPMTATQVVEGTISPIVSTTSLTSSLNPSIVGQPVTLTATIAPGSATGTVTFKDDAVTLCGAVPVTSGSASCTTTFVASGAHAVTADYGGSTALSASTSTALAQTVNDQRIKTVEMIGKFLGRRNDLMAANEPGGDRQIDRLIGADASTPGSIRAVGSAGGAMQFDVATSLMRMMRYGAGANQLPSVAPASATPPFDVWIDGKYGNFRDGHASNDLDGHFGLVSVGADYVLGPKVVVGGMVQFDSMRQRSKLQVTEATGHGWMAGPYATLRVAEHLFWQARAARGGSSNKASPFQTYTDEFDTDRWLMSSALTGNWSAGPWVLRPSVSVAYISDMAKSYTDAFSMVVPEVRSRLGQAKLGPQVSYRYQFRPDILLEPRIGLQMISNFGAGTTTEGFGQVDGQNAGSAGTRGRLEFGVRAAKSRGIGLELSGSYDGIGAGDYPAFAFQAIARVPLNVR